MFWIQKVSIMEELFIRRLMVNLRTFSKKIAFQNTSEQLILSPICFASVNPTRPGGSLVGPRLTFVVYIPRTKNVEALRLNEFS